MNKRIKNNNGITLVAVVVTVVILIILAGISINLTLGDNGIITIAKKAKENIELAKIEEETELNELYTQLEAGGSSSGNLPYDSIAKLTEFKTAIANAIDEAGGIKPDITAETSVFADNIKGIVKEVTKGATATADNISEGKTAWVNGILITGNGKDNNSYYDDGKKLDVSNIWQYTETSDKYNTIYNITTDDMSKYNNILLSSSWDWTKYANTSEACIIPISEFKNGQTYRVNNYYNGSIQSNGYAEITYVSDTTIALKRGDRSAAIIFFL